MGFGLTVRACELLFCLLFWVGCRTKLFFPQQRDHITIYSHQIYSHSGVKTSSLETAGECCQWLKEQSGKVHVCELGFLKLLRICCRKDSEATLREHATSAVLCLVKKSGPMFTEMLPDWLITMSCSNQIKASFVRWA